MSKWIKGRLKNFDDIKANASRVESNNQEGCFNVYRSDRDAYLKVSYGNIQNFGEVVEIERWNLNSAIYEDGKSTIGFRSQKYYDEWFEWIGEEPPIIEPLPDSLWDISDW